MTNKYEKQKFGQGYTHIIGCDEVGRACLAGPVVAAAVILPQVESKKFKVIKFHQIRDSKQLSPQKREELDPLIRQHALAFGIGVVSEKIIDEINIHHASLLAMRKAVENLLSSFFVIPSESREAGRVEESIIKIPPLPSVGRDDKMLLAIDGKFKIPDLSVAQEAIIDGDAKILSIAAASIVAKVFRDNLMRQLHKKYPVYNLAQHKGYPTQYHRKAIVAHGLSPIHRLSFCQSLTTS